jgi:hypothetical protein
VPVRAPSADQHPTVRAAAGGGPAGAAQRAPAEEDATGPAGVPGRVERRVVRGEEEKPSRRGQLAGVGRGRGVPQRVVVTSPKTRAVARWGSSGTREIDEQTALGEVYMGALIRAQLRLSLFVCTLIAFVVGGLPMVFWLSGTVRGARVLGLPVPWLLLAVALYPAFAACGWWYVRQAEATERDFAEMVERRR